MMKKVIGLLMVVFMFAGCGVSFDTVRFLNTSKEIQTEECVVSIMEEPAVIAPVIAEVKKIRIMEPVLFDFDEAVIRADQWPVLNRVASLMDEYEDLDIILEGYASKEGPVIYNLNLSEDRANAVEAALIDLGVEKDRIKNVVGKGATEQFSQELEPNRRVMILTID